MSAPELIVVKWTSSIDGDNGYVFEEIVGSATQQFGPMPRDWIGPFIDERREVVEKTLARYSKVPEPRKA